MKLKMRETEVSRLKKKGTGKPAEGEGEGEGASEQDAAVDIDEVVRVEVTAVRAEMQGEVLRHRLAAEEMERRLGLSNASAAARPGSVDANGERLSAAVNGTGGRDYAVWTLDDESAFQSSLGESLRVIQERQSEAMRKVEAYGSARFEEEFGFTAEEARSACSSLCVLSFSLGAHSQHLSCIAQLSYRKIPTHLFVLQPNLTFTPTTPSTPILPTMISSLRVRCTESESRAEAAEVRVAELRSALVKAQARASGETETAAAAVAAQKEAEVASADQRAAHAAEVSGLQLQLQHRDQALAALEGDLRKGSAEAKSELRMREEEHRAQFNKAMKDNMVLLKSTRELDAAAAATNAKLESLNEQLEALQRQVEEERASAVAAAAAAVGEKAGLSAALAATEAALSTAQARQEELLQQDKAWAAECAACREEADTLRVQLGASEAQQAKLAQQLDSQKQQLVQAQEDADNLHTQATTLQSERESLFSDLAEARQALQALRDEHSALAARTDELAAALATRTDERFDAARQVRPCLLALSSLLFWKSKERTFCFASMKSDALYIPFSGILLLLCLFPHAVCYVQEQNYPMFLLVFSSPIPRHYHQCILSSTRPSRSWRQSPQSSQSSSSSRNSSPCAMKSSKRRLLALALKPAWQPTLWASCRQLF
jgi:hypothetical protein